MPMYDAAGGELVGGGGLPGQGGLRGAAGGLLARVFPVGGTRRALGSVYKRRDAQVWQLLSLAGTALVVAPGTTSPIIYVTDADLVNIFVSQLSATGAAAGLKLHVFANEMVNGLATELPGSPFTLTPSTGSKSLGMFSFAQNVGQALSVAIEASAPYTGGTLQVWAEAR